MSLQRRFGIRHIGRIDEHRDASRRRYQFAQQSQPLCAQFSGEKIYAGRVASRPGEARDKAKLYGVFGPTRKR